jgi:hypothetical protein
MGPSVSCRYLNIMDMLIHRQICHVQELHKVHERTDLLVLTKLAAAVKFCSRAKACRN